MKPDCPIGKATQFLGSKWTLELIYYLQERRRFCELQEIVGGVNPTTLSQRLKTLEGEEIIQRQVVPDAQRHVEFRVEIVSFVSTAFWGILWALFYRKSELNIVENMMAAVFFVGQTNFFSIIFHTAMLPFLRAGLITDQSVDIYDLATHLAYSFYFSRQLFRERLLLLIPKQLVLSILYFGLIVVIFFSVAFMGAMFGHVKQ